MSFKLSFCVILTLICVCVNCFSNIQQKRFLLTYEQGALKHSSLSRFKRQSAVYGNKNYMQGAAGQPSVVVMPSGGPPTYRGAGSSYGPPSVMVPNSYGRYGSQGAYGANNPTVVVNMPDSSSCTKKKTKKKKKKIFE